jgi:hypothetical protein
VDSLRRHTASQLGGAPQLPDIAALATDPDEQLRELHALVKEGSYGMVSCCAVDSWGCCYSCHSCHSWHCHHHRQGQSLYTCLPFQPRVPSNPCCYCRLCTRHIASLTSTRTSPLHPDTCSSGSFEPLSCLSSSVTRSWQRNSTPLVCYGHLHTLCRIFPTRFSECVLT